MKSRCETTLTNGIKDNASVHQRFKWLKRLFRLLCVCSLLSAMRCYPFGVTQYYKSLAICTIREGFSYPSLISFSCLANVFSLANVAPLYFIWISTPST